MQQQLLLILIYNILRELKSCFSINFNSIIIFTTIVATRFNKKRFNLKQQFSKNILNKSYILEDNNFNNRISNFNLLNFFFV